MVADCVLQRAELLIHATPDCCCTLHHSLDFIANMDRRGSYNSDRRGSEPFIDQTFMLQNQNYGVEILERLNNMRFEGCFTDVILCIGHEEFPCHRNVLAVSSPYFRAMFSSDLREGTEAKIVFNEVSPWTMKRVIEYAYTGKLEITVENAQDMLAAGSMFQYTDIVEACCKFLLRHLHPSNALGIEEFAHMHSCLQLQTEAHQFVLDNFSAVIEYEEFMELTFVRVITYLASDLIEVRSEETVYEAALKWILHDIDQRKHNQCDVMEKIRFATVEVQYLDDIILTDPLLANCQRCYNFVNDAKRFHQSKMGDCHDRRRRSMQADTFTPRPSTVAKEVMVVVGGLDNVNYVMQTMEMYDPLKDKWTLLPDMPVAAGWYSTASVRNEIFVCGGIVDGHIVPTVWRFEAGKRRWEEMEPMLLPRARHSSCSYNSNVYVIGGMNLSEVDARIEPVESIECFHTESNQWTVVGQAPFPRRQSRLVLYNQTIVEIGGCQGEAELQTLESYLCNGSKVTYSGEQFVLPECIRYAQIVVLNGIFYIIWETTKRFISLNPEKRTFRRLPDLHYPHKHSGASVLHGNVYISGGFIDTKPSRIVECYNPTANTWTVVKSMRQARACHGTATIQMS